MPGRAADRAIEAAEAWLACPCSGHSENVVLAALETEPGTVFRAAGVLLRSDRWQRNVDVWASCFPADSREAICEALIAWALAGVE